MEVVTRCPARSHDAASPMTIAPMPQLPRTVNVFVPASPTRAEIVAGLRITAPVAAGYIPLGLAYGLLVVQLGLPWWMAPALSLAAYSGSAELLVVTLASHNPPLPRVDPPLRQPHCPPPFAGHALRHPTGNRRLARLCSIPRLLLHPYR